MTAAPTDTTGSVVAPPRPRPADASSGYLSWEDLGIRMVGEGETAGLRIDVTTLDEEAVALASDDVRTYFQDIRRRVTDAVPRERSRELRAFLVGYTGFEKEVDFDPTRLILRSEGSTYYPRSIVPVSPRFDNRIVGIHETVYGIYLFDGSLDLLSTLEFQYGNMSSGVGWRSVVEAIQRAKTQHRSAG